MGQSVLKRCPVFPPDIYQYYKFVIRTYKITKRYLIMRYYYRRLAMTPGHYFIITAEMTSRFWHLYRQCQ